MEGSNYNLLFAPSPPDKQRRRYPLSFVWSTVIAVDGYTTAEEDCALEERDSLQRVYVSSICLCACVLINVTTTLSVLSQASTAARQRVRPVSYAPQGSETAVASTRGTGD